MVEGPDPEDATGRRCCCHRPQTLRPQQSRVGERRRFASLHSRTFSYRDRRCRAQVLSPHEISHVKIRRKYEIHVYSFFTRKEWHDVAAQRRASLPRSHSKFSSTALPGRAELRSTPRPCPSHTHASRLELNSSETPQPRCPRQHRGPSGRPTIPLDVIPRLTIFRHQAHRQRTRCNSHRSEGDASRVLPGRPRIDHTHPRCQCDHKADTPSTILLTALTPSVSLPVASVNAQALSNQPYS